jgi:hypothetical protein
LESSAQYSSFRNEHSYAFGAGRIVRSGIMSAWTRRTPKIQGTQLTCERKLNEDDDSQDHEHHVEDELFVVVHRDAVVHPRAMTVSS